MAAAFVAFFMLGMIIGVVIALDDNKRHNPKPLFFRFGNIPSDGKSTIYSHGEPKGKEKGISVYEAHKDTNGNWTPVLPTPFSEPGFDTYINFVHYSWNNVPKLLVTGKVIGYGTDNEPLLKNVKIIETL